MKIRCVSYLRSVFCAGGIALTGLVNAHALPAYGFMAFVPPSTQKTHLIGIQQGSALSREVSGFRGQGYYTSENEYKDFNRWYETSWTDLHLTWLTEIHPRWGLIWGIGSGERGPKYQIDPSFQLGFLYQQPLSKQSAWSMKLSSRLGGRLKEKTCTATYGKDSESDVLSEYKNVVTNCRLAANHLSPEEALSHLWNEAPRDRLVIALRYVRHF